MAKLNKKEVKRLVESYKYLTDNEHITFVRTLLDINSLDQIENEVIYDKVGKFEKERLNEIERIVKINYNKFKITLLDHYLDDTDFMKLTSEEKRLLKANIELFNKHFENKTGMNVDKYLNYLETNREF